MKNLALGFVYTVLGILTITIVMSIYARENRTSELQVLSSAVEETVENIMLHTDYEIADKDEFVADVVQNLSMTMDTDSKLTVDVIGQDTDKGILSIRVTEEFKHPNGNDGSVSCDRTVVFDIPKEEEKTPYNIAFYLSKEDMQNEQNCYKNYEVLPGDTITMPKNPQKNGKTFNGWKRSDGTDADFSTPLVENEKYYAVWN